MHHRSVLALVLVTGAVLGSLTGCAPSDADDEIEIWYRPGSLPSSAIEGVEAAFPDAEISLVETPDVDTRLQSALRSNSGVPDIAVALLSQYESVAERFVDTSEYGFDDVADEYYPWKVEMGKDTAGRQIGIPIDIGPFGFFYRADIFAAAGLPTDPAEVGALVSDWDAYRSAAQQVQQATGTSICDSATSVYVADRLSQGYYYADDDRAFDPDTDVNREAFERALSFGQDGVCLNIASPWETDWSAAIAQNKLTGWVGPAYVAGQMVAAGGDGVGQWRVATPPSGAASQFGSFLSVFESSNDPELATQVALWLTNPENQTSGYVDNSLFPSIPSSLDAPEVLVPDAFYGGQVTSEVLGSVAQEAPVLQIIPQSDQAATVFAEALYEATQSGTDPTEAYEAALKKALAL